MSTPDPGPGAAAASAPMTERARLVYLWYAAAFAVVLVLTNIIGTKLFLLDLEPLNQLLNGGDPITLTAGIVTYPITFWLTDVVSEIWGRKRADAMVILGFGMSLLMLLTVQVAKALPPSDWYTLPERGFETGAAMDNAFHAVFAYPHILLFASMTAYLVAQLFDVRLYHFWWRVTKGKHLWVRNNGSTMISQLVDTIIVNGIFLRFGLGMEWSAVWAVIVAVYVCKMIMAWIDTPLIYLGVFATCRVLGIERDRAPRSAPLA